MTTALSTTALRPERPDTKLWPIEGEPDACEVAVAVANVVFIFHVSRLFLHRGRLESLTSVDWEPADVNVDRRSLAMPQYGFSPTGLDWRSNSSMDTYKRNLQQYFEPGKVAKDVEFPWTQILQSAAARVNEFIRQVGQLQPPDWIQQVKQEYMVKPLWPMRKRATVWYGQGECVAGETVMEGPDGSERIDVLARRGQPIRVWALGPSGPVAAWASAPFLKGSADLYEFVLASGRRVKVTAGHRFLTDSGWRFASETTTGARLAVSSPELLGRGAYSPLVSPSSDPHSSQTLAGLPRHCSTCSHQCDRRLQSAVGSGLAFAPLLGGARVHGYAGLYEDDQARKLERSRPCLSACRPSTLDSSRREERMTDFALSHSGYRRSGSPSPNTLKRAPSAKGYSLIQPALASDQGQGTSADGACLPPLESLVYDTVLAVSFVRHDAYYDLHVPIYENYLANGIWHHNTGKGQMAVGIATAICYGNNLANLHCRTSSKGIIYVDYEDDYEEFSIRVSRISNAQGVPPPGNLLRFDPRGRLFVDIAEQLKAMIAANGGADGIIIDSAIPAVGGDALDSSPVGAFFNALAWIDIPPLIIAHETKAGNDDFPFGSQLWRTESAMTVNFQGSSETRRTLDGHYVRDILLRCTKANNGPRFSPLAFQLEFTDDDANGAPNEGPLASTWVRQQDPTKVSADLQAKLPPIRRIVATLRDLPDELTAKDIADLTGMELKTVQNTLDRNKGEVFSSDGGGRGRGNAAKWRVIQGGKA